jgi:hypothetical protein
MAKQDKLDRVPPYMPIIWQDWMSSPTIRSMSMTQQGIFLNILLHQWVYGSVPRDPWKLAKAIGADYETTLRLLVKYSEILVCCECGTSWTRVTCECGDTKLGVTCENLKLKNLKIDVNLGLALGTTEPNPTITSPKVTPPCAPFGGEGGGGVSTSVVDGYFDQAKKGMAEAAVEEKPTPTPTPAPSPLVDDLVNRLGMVKPPEPKVYGEWARRLENLMDGWGAVKYAKAIAYVFENQMYCRGIKTTKEDKSIWLAGKYEQIIAKMDADAEFAAKKPQDDRPGYLKNPSGKSGFGKSVV